MENISKKLNSVFSENSSFADTLNKVCFYSGNYIQNLNTLVEKFAPFGKVCFIARENTYVNLLKKVTAVCNGCGAKVVGVVIKDTNPNNLLVASKLFDLDDDVRLVITADNSLLDTAGYFCSIRNITHIVIPLSVNVHGVLNNKVHLVNGDSIDKITIKLDRHILLDEMVIEASKTAQAQAFANVISRVVDLIDYRVLKAVNSKAISVNAYNIAKEALSSTLMIETLPNAQKRLVLLQNGLLIELANLISNGVLTENASTTCAMRLALGNYYENNAELLLYLTIKILGIYALFAEKKKPQLLTFIDYNARAEYICKRLNVLLIDQAEVFKKQESLIRSNLIRVENVRLKLKNEIKSLYKFTKKIEDTFINLGGEKFSIPYEILNPLKHCGDLENTFNFMTIIREAGVTEFIEN